MVKAFNHGNWEKEKGLTVVDTVVSLTVITIISIAALSLAIFAANSRKKAGISRYFANLADESMKLYQAYSGSDFQDAFEILTGAEIVYNTDTTYYLNTSYDYVDSSAEYSYKVIYDFDSENKSLTVTAKYTDDGLIVERSTSR